MNSPTLDNPDIDIRCSRCGEKLLWDAYRNEGAGKIELLVKCECNGESKQATLQLKVTLKEVVFGKAENRPVSI